ncbi:MAG: DUF2330 domain-containing protein [Candidatus Berkelbacteria bacterium]|nr:DUF2330 domain-containing protein [Candidatus Berkelbacteria bacterium]
MPVEIISEKTVDMYNTAVLKASDEKSLSTWLADHGYNYPAGQDAALKSYVDSGWYFAVARIQPSLVNDPSTGRAMAHGDLTPLKFTFKTDKIIYPMKLTGVVLRSILPTDVADSPTDLPVGAQPEIVSTSMPLTLYVISAGKVEESSLTENYANWLLKNNLDEINTGLSGTQITGDKLFLTRLSATFVPDKITGDLTITSASNNSIIPAPVNKTADFWLTNALIFVVTILMLVLLLPGSIFIVSVVLQRFVRNKTVFIIASIYQILYCLLAILLWMLFISASGGSESFLSESGPLGVTAGMVLVLTAAIFFIIKMLRHYKKTFSPPA